MFVRELNNNFVQSRALLSFGVVTYTKLYTV